MGKSVVGRQSAVDGRESSVASRSPSAEPARLAKKSPLELDRLIHERLRLGIISALAVNDRLTFNDLKRLLRTTDGNLSVHARKLEEAQYIACEKSFEGRVPRTEYRLDRRRPPSAGEIPGAHGSDHQGCHGIEDFRLKIAANPHRQQDPASCEPSIRAACCLIARRGLARRRIPADDLDSRKPRE